ncbi:n-acetylglutamate synthase [uncultured Algibacter sp.]|uniref:n-acetylglutamate synthase n=1 Tax=uncultured Algibacter sp. TaxID=298659 RepID=UPI003217D2FF
MNYNNKRFRLITNAEHGEITSNTIFLYKQNGRIVTSCYEGESIIKGHLMGLVEDDGTINMAYHQVNKNGALKTGICTSKPKITKTGKLRLYESWQWTSGDNTKGESVLEEL